MSIVNQKCSLKKINKNIHLLKSKVNNLLLTDFNKFSLINCNLKTNKRHSHNNTKTYLNNSFKIQKNSNVNNFNLKFAKNFDKLKSNNKPKFHNNIPKHKKNIDILDINNISKQPNKSLNYNSVNNLIGINISVNYMNKDYLMNKIKTNSYISNYNNNYNIYNNNAKYIKNYNKYMKNYNDINKNNDININNKYINDSFNENSKINNVPYSSSGKNRVNWKNIFILNNSFQNDWEKVMENLKAKKLNKTKIEKKEIINNSKYIIENKKTLNSTDENNNISYNTNKTIVNEQNLEKSLSCKNIHFKPIQKQKKSSNINIYDILIKNMNKKINKFTKNDINDEKLYEIISEYIFKYNNKIEDKHQKKFILEMYYHINNIIKKKNQQIMNLQKKYNDIIQKNQVFQKDNENLLEQNNILIKNNNLLENKINELSSKVKNSEDINNNLKVEDIDNNVISPNKDKNEENEISEKSSSSINSEELESIRFFDKINMKKHYFMNIPELSFQNIYLNNKKDNDKILPEKKNIQQRHSYQGNKKINLNINKNKGKKKFSFKISKNNTNKKIKNFNSSKMSNHYKQKINIRYKKNFGSFINLFGERKK